MRALVVGAASWNTLLYVDRLPTAPGTVFAERSHVGLGGTAAGKALNLARLGHEVHLHTVLGADEAGERVTRALLEAGVHLHVDRDEDRTEQHVNLMTPDGGRLSIYRSVTRPAADLDLAPLVALAATCDVVVLNITDYVRRLVPALVARGIGFWTDLHDWDGESDYHRDFLAASSIVLSDDALGDRADPLCRALAAEGRLVVCTRGARGATAWTAGEEIRVAARPATQVVDTNGAGDAFTAGLVHGLHRGWPLTRALGAAAVAGAAAVSSQDLASPDLTAAVLESAG